MMASIFGKTGAVRLGKAYPHDPAQRGYYVAYRENQVNHCPGCGRSHWYIGRLSAECGFCGTALPLTETQTLGTGLFRPRGRRLEDFATAA